LNVFERKVYRRILGPVYDNEKENWRILTYKEIYARVKKTYYNRDNKVRLGLGMYREWKEIEFPEEYYIWILLTRLRGRPRNRWQDEVREDERIVGGEGWEEEVHDREEWKKLLRMARNRCILHMPME
jgi:hypothetical protein